MVPVIPLGVAAPVVVLPATPVDSAVVLVVVVDIAFVESVVLLVLLLQAATAAPIMVMAARTRAVFRLFIQVDPPLISNDWIRARRHTRSAPRNVGNNSTSA